MIEFTPFLAVDATGDGGNMVTQIADKMGVTPAKLISQIILFSAVLFTLRKLAFGPVEKILNERQKVIDETLANSEKVRQELAEATATKKEILQKAEAQAAQIIKDAQLGAENVAKHRLAEAAAEAEQLIVKSRAAMEIEKAQMEADLRGQISRLVGELSQRVTGKILTPEDHRRLQQETAQQVTRN